MKKILIAFAAVALLAAGCGSSETPSSATSVPEQNTVSSSSPAASGNAQTGSAPAANTPSGKAPSAGTAPQPGNTGSGSSGSQTPSGPKTYGMAEVQAASSAQKCWTAINGKVYDLTRFINMHPGGRSEITSICGKDGTSAFSGQHAGDRRPESMLANYYIGDLK